MTLGQKQSSPSSNMTQRDMRYSFHPPVPFPLRIIHLPLASCHSALQSIGESDTHNENKMNVPHKQHPELTHILKTCTFLKLRVIHSSDEKNCSGVNVSKEVQSLLATQPTAHGVAKEDKRIYLYSNGLLDRLHGNPED